MRAYKLGKAEQAESVRMCSLEIGTAMHWMGPKLISKRKYKKVRLVGIELFNRAVGKDVNSGQGWLGVTEGV